MPDRPDSHPRTRTHVRPGPPAAHADATAPDDTTQPDPRMVFGRTLAGSEAIRQRHPQMSLHARRLLMLFDGRRSLAQLPSIVRPNDVPTLLRELEAHGMITPTGMVLDEDPANKVHPDTKMTQVKSALAGVFEKELGHQASVLEARVQDCVSLVVLRNVLREVITLVAQRKGPEAADRIAAMVKKHGPF